MKNKKILLVSALTIIITGIGLSFLSPEKQPLTAKEALSGYLIDQSQRIQLQETSIAQTISRPASTIHPHDFADQDDSNETLPEPTQDEAQPAHNLAEHFRFLQTELAQGNTPEERTEFIRDHLLSTLSSDQAGELIDLYEKFTQFEQDAATKAEEWDMPENASETLELIGAMQQYQHEYFGPETAQRLFGAEMKVMEFNARRAIIINDSFTSGSDKEQLLERLSIDMWGEEAYQALNANKDPYDILDEKLQVYHQELAALDPETRQQEINKLRATHLPAGW